MNIHQQYSLYHIDWPFRNGEKGSKEAKRAGIWDEFVEIMRQIAKKLAEQSVTCCAEHQIANKNEFLCKKCLIF